MGILSHQFATVVSKESDNKGKVEFNYCFRTKLIIITVKTKLFF